MFRNYIVAMMRNLWKNKSYSFLNIFGLAIGIVCAGIIFLWVEDEVNYDNVHVKKDRLFQVLQNWDYDGDIRTFGSTSGLLSPAIKAEVPGIANTARVTDFEQTMLFTPAGDKSVYAGGRYADSSIFSMFTMPFVQGNAKDAFKEPYSMVITERTAKKFFGDDKQVLGKAIKVDNKEEYIITGVIKDFPANSSLKFEWVAPYELYAKGKDRLETWGSNSPHTYVELAPNASIVAVNKQLHGFIKTKHPSAIWYAFLFSMNDWRLHDTFENGVQTGGRIKYVQLFSIIAWIILFIACINFMNLSTARSEKRAREVGVRKVMGAGKRGLVMQFMGEALMTSFMACVVAVIIMQLVLPFFNVLINKSLVLGLTNPLHWLGLLLITFICGTVSGSYPSLYLSSFNPVAVLKGFNLKMGGAAFVRKGLVIVQFTVSIVLIICTIIVYQQIGHIKSRDIGYDKDNLLVMELQGNMLKNFAAIRQDLVNTGMIENAALSNSMTLYGGNNTSDVRWEGKPNNSQILFSMRMTDPGYMSTIGMTLLEGRDFNKNAVSDSFSVIVTESMAKVMGGGNVLGRQLEVPGVPASKDRFTITGVVKDYVYGDMYGQSDPAIFFCWPDYTRLMYIRTKANVTDPVKALAAIEGVLQKDNPGYPFSYRFVDDQFNEMFANETLIGKLAGVFAALAIMISCLGLFGLAAYTAERRTKEIGIRKVLGASIRSITGLLSKDFLQLVCISALIAFPLAWWVMNSWLQNYAYHVAIHWWVFLIAGFAAVFISLVTVSYQSVRAALMNPVKSLKAD